MLSHYCSAEVTPQFFEQADPRLKHESSLENFGLINILTKTCSFETVSIGIKKCIRTTVFFEFHLGPTLTIVAARMQNNVR